MNETPAAGQKGEHFTSVEMGPMERLDEYSFLHPRTQKDYEGKLFLKEALGLTGMEVSLNKLPARGFMPFFHKHQENEELYIFIKGRGEFMVGETVIPIREGTAIRVAPEGERTWRNHLREDLYYIVIQAKAGTMPQGTINDGRPVDRRVRWKKSDDETQDAGGARRVVRSSKSFDEVTAAFEAAAGPLKGAEIDKAVSGAKSYAEMEKALRALEGPAGFMLFARMDLGRVLRQESGSDAPRSMRYLIGNPLIMKELVRRVPDAGSYAPVTVLIDERADGVRLSYDSMAASLAPYGNEDALAVARDLDAKVETLLRNAAGN